MNKDRGIEFFSGAPDRLKPCVIEVQSIYASELRIRINMRSDLRAAQPKFPDAAFQFSCGEVGSLFFDPASRWKRAIRTAGPWSTRYVDDPFAPAEGVGGSAATIPARAR